MPGVLRETFLNEFPVLAGESHDGDTVLTGCLDQAALQGVLGQIESLALTLIVVRRVLPHAL
ncbi:MAG TPA: hypothetical protein VGD91_07640 [Trebonia sp.]